MAMVASRTDGMSAFNNSLDLDDVHTPASDYSAYSQGNMLSAASGHFIYSHSSHADMNGPVWDAPTDGPQDFHGDEDFHFFGQMTPRAQDRNEALDDMTSKWVAAEPAMAAPEPMRRIGSQSSSRSSKNRTLKALAQKPRPRILTSVSHSQPMTDFDLTGNPAVDGLYLPDDAQSVTPATMYYPVALHLPLPMDGLCAGEGMAYSSPSLLGSGLAHQHIDPAHTVKFESGIPGNSPSASWGSLSPESRLSSPDIPEDTWSNSLMGTSPAHTNNSSPVLDGSSPSLDRQMGMMTTDDINGHMLADDMFSLSPPFTRRASGDGESSARDHPYYKRALPRADDGLFHCPWEGQASCNHKPEKLKCNYDKFVDSHLKPYRCKAEACENARFSSTACLLRHEREAHAMHGHGDKPYLCTYEGCERSTPGSGFPRQWNLRDHMRRVHSDNGTSLNAQTPSDSACQGASAQAAKSRKRKSKDSVDSNASSRKQASKSAQAAEAAAAARAAEQPLIDEWFQHQKALQTSFQSFNAPDAFDYIPSLDDATAHIDSMIKISKKLQQKKTPRDSYRRSYGHSG
ncbi:hypothetical protein F5Y17DRAFT_325429 [Xylariaceae sp. FL0594]|nr:hypothetical protein F5Y17DRAFT_325429 [Xylariaceae sp. FL0594]